MLSVIIRDEGEKKVTQLTYENLWRELKDIPDSELLVADDWFDALEIVKNKYVCFVEADCLVNSGYFQSQIGLFKKDDYSDKLAVLSSATAISQWHNKIYGYEFAFKDYIKGFSPVRSKKSSSPYPVQVAYIPGAIIRVSMLRKYLDQYVPDDKDLITFSVLLSLGLWDQGKGKSKSEGSLGYRVHINPNATYVTTDDHVNEIGQFDLDPTIEKMFEKESI